MPPVDETLEKPDHPDKDILKGGPGDEGDDAGKDKGKVADEDKATLRSYTVGGREYKLPAEVVDALKGSDQAVGVQIAELKAQLAALQGNKAAPPGGKKDLELEDLIFVDPKAALARIKDDIRKELSDQAATKDAQAAFWSRFYEKNDNLRDYHMIVQAVLDNSRKELQNHTVDEAITEIAKRTKALIVKGTRDLGANADDAEVEGAGVHKTRTASKDKDSKDDSAGSLSAHIRARKAARSESRLGKQQ